MKCTAVAKHLSGVLVQKVFVAQQRSDHYTGCRRRKSRVELFDQPLPALINPIDRRSPSWPLDDLDQQRAFNRTRRVYSLPIEKFPPRHYAWIEKLVLA